MIDPVSIGLAVAGARTAVKGIREAIKLGHDIKDCYGELVSFFTHQGEIEAAAKQNEEDSKKPGPKPKNATAMAMEIVMQRRQMRDFERELRDMFTIKGELELYNELIAERNKIIQAREAEIRAAKKAEELKLAQKKRKFQLAMQEMEHAISIVFCILVMLVAIIGTIAVTMSVTK